MVPYNDLEQALSIWSSAMTKRVSSREASAHFGELAEDVRQTGEPVIFEKQGGPW
jgi:hypothetical protein